MLFLKCFSQFLQRDVCFIKGKWSFMLKITSFLGLQQMVVIACACTWVYLAIIINTLWIDCHYRLWKLESVLNRVLLSAWLMGLYFSRCGSRSWATTWAWRWLQRGTTGRQTLTLRYCIHSGVCLTVLEDCVCVGAVNPSLTLCFRMTYQSRSRGGEQRPSRAQDVRSTSGRRHTAPRVWTILYMM